MDNKLIYKIFINILICFSLIKIFIDLNDIEKYCQTHRSIDFELKAELEKCYLTVHNFVSFNSTIEINPYSNLSEKNIKLNESLQNQNFHTYISAYNKPFLIELIQNTKNSCLCCN